MISNTPVEYAVAALASYLTDQMPEIQQVLLDFPNPNQTLKMPSITLTADTSNAYTSHAPYELTVSDPDDFNRVLLTWCVGQFDFKVQLDLWARNRPERNAILSHFYYVFNKKIMPMGLSLELLDYYRLFARYDVIGYSHEDSEQSSQRGEWRTRVDLLTSIPSVLTQSEFAMTRTIVTTFEIQDTSHKIEGVI